MAKMQQLAMLHKLLTRIVGFLDHNGPQGQVRLYEVTTAAEFMYMYIEVKLTC